MLVPATLAALESDGSISCAEAMGRLELTDGGSVVAASVWGDDAQVRLGGDTVFLTRTSAGWRIAAAGCRPRGDAPYDCRLEGP
jgi:hypothetical protein